MKKLLFFLLPFLLLAGCGERQECLDYRDSYYKYTLDKQQISSFIPLTVEGVTDNTTYSKLEEFDMFYSEEAEKCIAGYHISRYYPVSEGHTKYDGYYIYDALNDIEIKGGEGGRAMKAGYENDIEYYRTGEGELKEWGLSAGGAMVDLSGYGRS